MLATIRILGIISVIAFATALMSSSPLLMQVEGAPTANYAHVRVPIAISVQYSESL